MGKAGVSRCGHKDVGVQLKSGVGPGQLQGMLSTHTRGMSHLKPLVINKRHRSILVVNPTGFLVLNFVEAWSKWSGD
jgi:hypothetical protein